MGAAGASKMSRDKAIRTRTVREGTIWLSSLSEKGPDIVGWREGPGKTMVSMSDITSARSASPVKLAASSTLRTAKKPTSDSPRKEVNGKDTNKEVGNARCPDLARVASQRLVSRY